MKKILLLALASILVLMSISGCGSSKNEVKLQDEPTNDENITEYNGKSSQEENASVEMLSDDEWIVFHVSRELPLEENAWLGIIPTGTIYEKETDADDVDIIYSYCDNYDLDGAKSFIFKYEKEWLSEIEDGTYDLVLCSSDDAEKGVVLIQIGIEIEGTDITLDFDNEK